MAWDLSANYSFELLRHDLVNAVGPERMAQLMPAYPREGLSIVTHLSTTEDTADTEGELSTKKDFASVSSASSVVERFANVPKAAARYPTTADLSPDTSPESA